MAHLTMRLSGACIHTERTILITYYLTCNVFCPVLSACPASSTPLLHAPPIPSLNKWKNIHRPGLLLNFSLSASNLKWSCRDVTGASTQRGGGKGRRSRRRDGDEGEEQVTFGPVGSEILTLLLKIQ